MRRSRTPYLLACLAQSLLLVPAAQGIKAPPEGTALPSFDSRFLPGLRLVGAHAVRAGRPTGDLLAGPPAAPDELQLAALARLEKQSGARIEVRWDDLTGSPHLLVARSGSLGSADGRSPAEVAREFLATWSDLFRLSPEQALALRPVAEVPVEGGTVVRFEQEIAGLSVDHGHVAVTVGKDGRVLQLAGGRVTGRHPTGGLEARLTPGSAVEAIASAARIPIAGTPEATRGPDGEALFALPGVDGAIRASRLVVPTVFGPRLAWRAVLPMESELATYELIVDDATGQPIRRQNLILFLDTRGDIFRVSPARGPLEERRFPDGADYRTDLSPLGWSFLDQTEGNNGTARGDVMGDNENTLGPMATATPPGPYYHFDAPFTGNPSSDLDHSITQLFYGINFSHDRFYALGFDEPSGNYQADNFGRGGLEGDAPFADAQDGRGTNNAIWNPAPEGVPGRMEMFVWDLSAPPKDAADDVGVVIHEYAHGVSTRLVGGAHDVSCLRDNTQGGAMGEGWGDYFAASWTGDVVVGAYLTGNPDGIRIWHLDENPPDKDYSRYCQLPRDNAQNNRCEVHDNGELWSGFLWDVHETLVDALGPDGADVADRLVVDGMKLTPCDPSMLDARDGILLADQLAHGGAHSCLIKGAAARAGMGFGASSTGTGDTAPVGSNEPWPECSSEGTVIFTRAGLEEGQPEAVFSCADQVTIAVTDGDASLPVRVTVMTSLGDVETLDLLPGPDPAVFTITRPTDAVGPVQVDEAFQVEDGGTIEVLYLDGGREVRAQASIDCSARLEVVAHRFVGSTCDPDTVEGFPDLPGFLDASETTDLVLSLANHMPLPVQGLARVSLDPPTVASVLPSATPLFLELPAAVGATPGRQDLVVRLVAADDLLGLTAADVVVTIDAPGYDPTTEYRRTIGLDQDYALVPGLTLGFDPESEDAPPVGPDWTTGTLADGPNEWTIVECAAATGTRSYRNGPPDCTGTYMDDQGAPYLAPPPLLLVDPSDPGSTVAARLVEVAYTHDMELGVDGGFFDADAVIVYAVEDPSAIDPPGSLFGLDGPILELYANLQFGGRTGTTDGFEPVVLSVDPERVEHLDLLEPFSLAWVFVPDITPSERRGTVYDAQGRGYYLDDLVVTYDAVNVVPAAGACTIAPAAYSRPVLAEPSGGVGCEGEAVAIDASLSESEGCTSLGYRFLVGGTPVGCFADRDGLVARPQDAEGWGDTPTCFDFPPGDATYDVEVRCVGEPASADTRSVGVRLIHATPVPNTTPNAFCGAPVLVDLFDSAVAGCPGDLEYLFMDATGLPIDCDGDGQDWSSDPTCELADAGVAQQVLTSVRCAGFACDGPVESLEVPALTGTALAREQVPGNSPYCPGSAVPVTAQDTAATVTGCDGDLEYRWTAPGVDTGWRLNPLVNLVLPMDDTVTLSVQCTTATDCPPWTTELPIDIRGGDYEVRYTYDVTACAGAPLQLDVDEIVPIECDAPGDRPLYRFLRDGFLLDCDGDGVEDDFGTATTCMSELVDGGAQYRLDATCESDMACRMSSGVSTIAPVDPDPSGDPQGTLLVTKTGDCPPAEVMLDWSDSGRARQEFVVLRALDDPRFQAPLADHRLVDVAGVSHADDTADCIGTATPSVYFYKVVDRNPCTGEPIPDPEP